MGSEVEHWLHTHFLCTLSPLSALHTPHSPKMSAFFSSCPGAKGEDTLCFQSRYRYLKLQEDPTHTFLSIMLEPGTSQLTRGWQVQGKGIGDGLSHPTLTSWSFLS